MAPEIAQSVLKRWGLNFNWALPCHNRYACGLHARFAAESTLKDNRHLIFNRLQGRILTDIPVKRNIPYTFASHEIHDID
jgi:hypothetical protein